MPPAAPGLLILSIHIGTLSFPVKTRQNQSYKFKKTCQKFQFSNSAKKYQHTTHLLKIINVKWIQRVLWKIPSRHDSAHRRTDGRTDGQGETTIPSFHRSLKRGYNWWTFKHFYATEMWREDKIALYEIALLVVLAGKRILWELLQTRKSLRVAGFNKIAPLIFLAGKIILWELLQPRKFLRIAC